jgi:hypothetical protein
LVGKIFVIVLSNIARLVFVVVVSELQDTMIAYVLDKEIGAERILGDINNLINKFRNESPEQIPILVIQIKSISKDDISLIPKLESKNLDTDCTI